MSQNPIQLEYELLNHRPHRRQTQQAEQHRLATTVEHRNLMKETSEPIRSHAEPEIGGCGAAAPMVTNEPEVFEIDDELAHLMDT